MNILIEKLQRLEILEEIANHAEADYEREPENTEYEETFDRAYKNEFEAFVRLAKHIVFITNNEIDFNAAKKMIQTKRKELISLLSI